MNDTVQVSRMVRTALFVSNLDNSSRFYKEGLGYREVYSGGTIEHEVAHALLGVPTDRVIRYEIVKADGPNFATNGGPVRSQTFAAAGAAPQPGRERGGRLSGVSNQRHTRGA